MLFARRANEGPVCSARGLTNANRVLLVRRRFQENIAIFRYGKFRRHQEIAVGFITPEAKPAPSSRLVERSH